MQTSKVQKVSCLQENFLTLAAPKHEEGAFHESFYLPTYLSFRLYTIVRLYGQDGSHICFQNGRSGLTDLSLYENGVEKYLLAISENDSPCL